MDGREFIMRYKPSPATDYENSFNYRIEWDDCINATFADDLSTIIDHDGPRSMECSDYDYAWDEFEYYRSNVNPTYIRVRLIRINPLTGDEEITHQS